MSTPPVTLRPFQERAFLEYRKAFKTGTAHLGIAPTAFGKSIFAGVLASRMVPKTRHRFVILAHREALVRQNAEKVLKVDPSLRVGVEMADQKASPSSDVISVSIGSLKGKRLDNCATLWKQDGRPLFLIIDEAHHTPADTYQAALKVLSPDRLLGLTATPERPDDEGGLTLRSSYPEIAFNIPRGEMIDDGWLAKPLHWCIKTAQDISKIKKRMGDFVEAELSRTLNVSDRNDLVVASAENAASILQESQGLTPKGVCFCIDIAHGEELERLFLSSGWAAKLISGSTPVEDRLFWDQSLRGATKKTVLISCGVLTEGWDVEEVNLGIFARPTKSNVLADQMLGRVLRLHPSKKEGAVVIDFQDGGEEVDRVSIASTFRLPSEWDGGGVNLREDELWFRDLLSRSSYVIRSQLWKCHNRDAVMKVMAKVNTSAEPVIFPGGEFLWWDLGPELRMIVKFNSIVIEMTPIGDYEIRLHHGLSRARIGVERTIQTAIGKAEAWVSSTFPEDSFYLRLDSTKRAETTVSQAQLDYLERLEERKPDKSISKHEARVRINVALMEKIREVEEGRMGFGKHKGSPLSLVSNWYLKFMIEDPKMDWLRKGGRPELDMAKAELLRRGIAFKEYEEPREVEDYFPVPAGYHPPRDNKVF